MRQDPLHLTDFYKVDHRRQYPEGTQLIYSNLTARKSRMPGVNAVVVFGIQYFVQEYLIRLFTEEFFDRPVNLPVEYYRDRLNRALGKDAVSMDHIHELHKLGYLPLHIKALPEGTRCPIGVPILTVVNTDPRFFWLTNFLETLLCNVLWHPITSATIADQYRQVLDQYARETSDNPEFVNVQGHDFSMRGHTSIESAAASGAAHLLSFTGTDTIPALDFLDQYYHGEDSPFLGGSIPATEHSVMCAGGRDEKAVIRRLITEVYPKGPVSIVCDTWDYWKILLEVLPALKADIMQREGTLVVRPDSGDPVKILCGDPEAATQWERLGTIETLWHLFGGRMTSKGYKQLDPHIGVIYGDSITLDRCKDICRHLKERGFASTNVVFGIGSYTYQHVTRDTFSFAMKATFCVVDKKGYPIFKDPVTDTDRTKKSHKGLLHVTGDLQVEDNVSWTREYGGMLRTVFKDGCLRQTETVERIRGRLRREP